MSDSTEEFDDPALKAAIRRSFELERAPESLRAKVAAAMTAEDRPVVRQSSRRQFAYALAAVLVVGLGIGAFVVSQRPEPAVPNWFADAMITTHDTCKTLADHKLIPGIPADNPNALRQKLQETLGHAALVAKLDDGWVFKGAGICEINKVPAAHLMFAKGEETLSIFSVSAKLLYSTATTGDPVYSQSRNGHDVAGFVHDGAIHCFVLQSPTRKTGIKQIIAMRDRFRTAKDTFSTNRILDINR